MQVEVIPEETAVLIRWKKRSDNHVLVRMKAEAVLYASRGVDVGIFAELVERTERAVQEWLAEWQATRMCSVLTGHAGNQNAAKLTRTRKEELKPSSPSHRPRRVSASGSGTSQRYVTS